MNKRVGFIGVGLMGHGMAKNLVEKGFALTVLGHRNRAPVDSLVSKGAKEAKTPRDLAAASDIIITVVGNSPQLEDIVFRGDGILAGLKPGAVMADCTTAMPESSLKIAAAVNKFLADPGVQSKLRAQFLEPIPGTPAGIQKRGENEAALWGQLIRDLKIQGD